MIAWMDNKWFAQYCNLAAANTVDKNGEVRFKQKDLSDRYGNVPQSVLDLHRNIIGACNKQFNSSYVPDNEVGEKLLETLINIQTSYLNINGLWEDNPQDDKDEYGFEIF